MVKRMRTQQERYCLILKLIENSGSGLTFSTSFWLYKIQLIMKRNTLKGIKGLILTRVEKKKNTLKSTQAADMHQTPSTITLRLLLSTNPAIHHKARGDIKLLNRKKTFIPKMPEISVENTANYKPAFDRKIEFSIILLKASIFTAVLNVEGEGLVTIHPPSIQLKYIFRTTHSQ